jgi:hypothetical protein
MKPSKVVALLLATAVASGGLAFLGAMASTNSRTAALEAKVAELERRTARPPGDFQVLDQLLEQLQ